MVNNMSFNYDTKIQKSSEIYKLSHYFLNFFNNYLTISLYVLVVPKILSIFALKAQPTLNASP